VEKNWRRKRGTNSPICQFLSFRIFLSSSCSFVRPVSGDPEDLWDFGTVRHVGRQATVGRHIQVSGPPLTWEHHHGYTPSDGSSSDGRSSSSGSSQKSTSSSITTKGDLPPLPASPTKRHDEQATVRNAHTNGVDEDPARQRTPRREPSEDADDEYEYPDPYTVSAGAPQRQYSSRTHLEEELPDTTMLDSVVLPAIASVRFLL
jgi:serine/threonine-protein kinase 24/25/MST4